MTRAHIVLHRNDPEKDPLIGHIKVTRSDWLNCARDLLINEGVAGVKILSISARLGVSRSSFYWYFKSRPDLLNALLEDWEARNTTAIIEHCALPAATINEAACNFFRCFVTPDLFDDGLDFAVRDWARRDAKVRARIDNADQTRLSAVCAMFQRFGYAPDDADARARILYFMQLGYHALDQTEPMRTRLSRVEHYLLGFTGVPPTTADMDAFKAFATKA